MNSENISIMSDTMNNANYDNNMNANEKNFADAKYDDFVNEMTNILDDVSNDSSLSTYSINNSNRSRVSSDDLSDFLSSFNVESSRIVSKISINHSIEESASTAKKSDADVVLAEKRSSTHISRKKTVAHKSFALMRHSKRQYRRDNM